MEMLFICTAFVLFLEELSLRVEPFFKSDEQILLEILKFNIGLESYHKNLLFFILCQIHHHE